MGKKQQGTKRSRSDSEDLDEEDADEELEAEMAVLAAIQAEKAGAEGDHDEITTGKPVKKAYNREGLLQALESIGELPFVESFTIADFPIDVQDEHDDLEREMAFYNQSVSAVREGRRRLEALNIPTKRPSDYFCENVKTDMHMNRIKDRLLLEEKKIKGFEQRKQRETTRKFSKQLQDLKKQEKTQRIKKDTEEAGRSSGTFGHGDSSSGGAGKGREGAGGGQSDGKSARRLNMDKKYGLKGREKKKAKLSDRKSLNDLSDYNPRGGKMVRREKASASPKGGGGGGGKGGKGKGKGNRPGKEARSQRRASRSSSA